MSKIGDSIKTAADSAKDSLATAKAKTTQSTAAARAKASVAYEKGKGAAASGVTGSVTGKTMFMSRTSGEQKWKSPDSALS